MSRLTRRSNCFGSLRTFRESWQQAYGGQNLRKVAVLEKGMKYHELALNNSDAQFIEARGYKVPEICRIFRVPPHKVADLSRATFSNIESQSIEFWTDTMLPWAECWESSIERFLLGEDTDLEVELDMRRLMRGDSASRTAYRRSWRPEPGVWPVGQLEPWPSGQASRSSMTVSPN